MPSRTLQRLNRQIQEKVAHIVLHELKDPRVGFVTITRTELAADYSNCRVFYSVMGGSGDRSKTQHALEGARGYIQGRVGDTLRTRLLPVLSFHFDEAVEGVAAMGRLMQEIRRERLGREGEVAESEAREPGEH